MGNCNICDDIKLVERFETPKRYQNTIEYIKGLIKEKGFILLEGNEPLYEYYKTPTWGEDIIYHIIQCPNCHQKFICVVNTYRGGGSFTRK